MKYMIITIFILTIFSFNNTIKINNNDSSYIVMEKSTERILEEKNSDKQMLVASTVKILTCITVIENYNLDEEIMIEKCDTEVEGSKVYLQVGDKIRRRDLLYALMLRSANDAASALSDNDCEEFINKMNNTAKKIGMNNSIFCNASGLDEINYNLSTAYDMALLSIYASSNDTFLQISSKSKYDCKTIKNNYFWINKHRLVKSNDNFIWGKTGYTKKSKRILVSEYNKNNVDLIIVTINNSDDWEFHKNASNKYSNMNFIKVFSKGVYDIKLDVNYYLYIKEDIVIPLLDDEDNRIKLKFKLYKNKAKLEIYLDNKLICVKNIDVFDKDSFDYELLITSLS